jgi:hypothetical protein
MAPVGEGWDPPPSVRDRVEFHWFHVSPGRALVLCVLSGQPLWYVGHFDSGRMQPCLPEHCGLCARGVGKQLRYVVSSVELSSKQIGVLEMSKTVAELLRSWSSRNGGLHGMVIELQRATRSKHSRMECSYLDELPPGWALAMEGLDLKEVLSRTWERQEG